jgi:hypothetical protein
MPKPEIFFVTPELQQVLDSLPPGTPRSKLDPLRPFILRWRRERRGYREIQQILRNECRVKASLSTLFHFVKSRSKPRKPIQPDIEIEPATVEPVIAPQPQTRAAAIPNKNSDQSSDPYAEARERMRKHKEAATVQKSEPLFPIYTDDELLEPHVLDPKKKEEN